MFVTVVVFVFVVCGTRFLLVSAKDSWHLSPSVFVYLALPCVWGTPLSQVHWARQVPLVFIAGCDRPSPSV